MGGEPTAKRKAQKGQKMNITSSTVTIRDLLNAVISGNITEAIRAKAQSEIAKLDATNAKRAEKAKEKAKENDPIKQTIYDCLVANGTKTTVEIATACGLTVPKTSAMCRQMADDGRLTSSDVSVKGKGKQKAYTAVA